MDFTLKDTGLDSTSHDRSNDQWHDLHTDFNKRYRNISEVIGKVYKACRLGSHFEIQP